MQTTDLWGAKKNVEEEKETPEPTTLENREKMISKDWYYPWCKMESYLSCYLDSLVAWLLFQWKGNARIRGQRQVGNENESIKVNRVNMNF